MKLDRDELQKQIHQMKQEVPAWGEAGPWLQEFVWEINIYLAKQGDYNLVPVCNSN